VKPKPKRAIKNNIVESIEEPVEEVKPKQKRISKKK